MPVASKWSSYAVRCTEKPKDQQKMKKNKAFFWWSNLVDGRVKRYKKRSREKKLWY